MSSQEPPKEKFKQNNGLFFLQQIRMRERLVYGTSVKYAPPQDTLERTTWKK